jgi:hypothetical protein
VSRQLPPRSATWLLGCLLSEADRDAVIGDLIEEHELRRSLSSPRVSWWYWSQVWRSVLPLLWIAARRERWPGILGAAIAAYALVTIVESAATIAVQRLLVPEAFVQVLINLIVGLSAMVMGGYVAARIRRGAAAVLAIIIAVVVVGLMTTNSGSVPLWYQVGFLVFGPMASLAGGALLRRT